MAKWKIDPDHVSAGFAVRHMMVAIVQGLFTRVIGTILFDPAKPAATSVEIEIDAASVYTGTERRDNHLRSADFFDVERFPTIRFKSRITEVVGHNALKVAGDLTIRGVTLPTLFDVVYVGPSIFEDDDKTYTSYGVQAITCVQREDFGLIWNLEFGDGRFMVGKHVDISFNAEIDLED